MNPAYWIAQVASLAVGFAGAEGMVDNDRRAVAAAVEVWGHDRLTALSPHEAATVFWDDAGINLVDYLRKRPSQLGQPVNCEATDLAVVPSARQNLSFIPKDMLATGGLRELTMVIRCVGSRPIDARIWYRADTLAKLQYIVEGEGE